MLRSVWHFGAKDPREPIFKTDVFCPTQLDDVTVGVPLKYPTFNLFSTATGREVGRKEMRRYQLSIGEEVENTRLRNESNR